MDLAAIRVAVADILNAVDGLRAFPYAPDQLPVSSTPTAVVLPAAGEYVRYLVTSRGGAVEVDLRVQLIVQTTDPRTAEQQLDRLLSAGAGHDQSVVDALLADRWLGGLVADITPRTARDVGAYTVGDVAYLGAFVDLLVLTDRL